MKLILLHFVVLQQCLHTKALERIGRHNRLRLISTFVGTPNGHVITLNEACHSLLSTAEPTNQYYTMLSLESTKCR